MSRAPAILIGDVEQQPEDRLFEWSAFDLRLPSSPIETTHVVGLRDSTRRPTVTGSIKRVDPKRLWLLTTTDRVYRLDGPPFDRSVSKFLAFKWATDKEAMSVKDSTPKIVGMLSMRAQRQFVVTLSSTSRASMDVFCEIRIHSIGASRFASMPVCVIPNYGTSWRQPVTELSSHHDSPVVRLLRDMLPKLSDSDRYELRPDVGKAFSLSVYEGPEVCEDALLEHLVAERDGNTMRVELCTDVDEYKASGTTLKFPTTAALLEHAIQMVLPEGRRQESDGS